MTALSKDVLIGNEHDIHTVRKYRANIHLINTFNRVFFFLYFEQKLMFGFENIYRYLRKKCVIALAVNFNLRDTYF